MLSAINQKLDMCSSPMHMQANNVVLDRYQRNEKEDMKRAIELLYEFNDKIRELHPACLTVVENMLQRPRY